MSRTGLTVPTALAAAPTATSLVALVEPLVELFEPQGAIGRVDVDMAERRPRLLGRQHPGRDVGVVIEPGDDDLVTRPPGLGQRPAEGESQRGHVQTEDHCVRISTAEQIGDGGASRVGELADLDTGGEQTAVVGVAMGQAIRNGGDDVVRHLTAGRAVEKDRLASGDLAGESGELTAA